MQGDRKALGGHPTSASWRCESAEGRKPKLALTSKKYLFVSLKTKSFTPTPKVSARPRALAPKFAMLSKKMGLSH